ncbi:MAG: hypothetical protein J2P19_35270 [Pseudonocardia sp.]|nr:hypothetical protein [Pseudonocardia sp.]
MVTMFERAGGEESRGGSWTSSTAASWLIQRTDDDPHPLREVPKWRWDDE